MNDLRARLMRHIEPKGDCWEWTGSRDRQGYGKANAIGQTLAHRIVYEVLAGPIPEGLTLDHLCRNRACVNPDHLEPVTMTVNILRGFSPQAINARKEKCPRGHPLDAANTYRSGKTGRACRTCTLVRQRAARKRMGNWNARQTVCIHGHPFDEVNTRLGSDGRRACRACDRVRAADARERARHDADEDARELLIEKLRGEAREEGNEE